MVNALSTDFLQIFVTYIYLHFLLPINFLSAQLLLYDFYIDFELTMQIEWLV